MYNFKKNIIKAVSIVMIAVIAVMTPLSDYADTQGIGETHAVAPAVISLAKLFGVIAGAYGIYVAADKLAEETDLWENWTATNDAEAHKSIQDIKLGVASYIVKRQLMKSVANYLATKVSESVKIIGYGAKSAYNTLPDTIYTTSFLEYLDTLRSKRSYGDFLLVRYIEDSSYDSGIYRFYYLNGAYLDEVKEENNYYQIDLFSYLHTTGQNYFGYLASDEYGLLLDSKRITLYYADFYYSPSSGGWQRNKSNTSQYNVIEDDVFDTGYVYTTYPFYRTTLKSYSSLDLQKLIDNSIIVKNATIDYSVHGEKANANITNLAGQTVTQGQLETVYDASKTGIDNVIQFPGNDNNNNNNNIDTQALSNAISIAVANALIQAGIGNNSGEDSGSDSEGSAEQVGLLRQILNALTDINPIPSLREILELLGKKFGDISIGHNGIINSIAENSPVPTLREINEALGYKLGDIKTSLSNVVDAITQSSPIQALEQIGENIASLPQQIADNVKLFISELFVPDTTEIEEAVDDLRTKFVFADSMITVVDDFKGILKSSNGPPVIYIDFTESEDERYHSVGRLVAVDFAWYERYKPYGDAILSAIIYAFFIWRMFRLIPNILNGVSSSVEVGSSSSGTLTGTIPTFDNPRIGKG